MISGSTAFLQGQFSDYGIYSALKALWTQSAKQEWHWCRSLQWSSRRFILKKSWFITVVCFFFFFFIFVCMCVDRGRCSCGQRKKNRKAHLPPLPAKNAKKFFKYWLTLTVNTLDFSAAAREQTDLRNAYSAHTVIWFFGTIVNSFSYNFSRLWTTPYFYY